MMKNIVIFSNPFGNGPAGKSVSIARYIVAHSNPETITVYICGSIQLISSTQKNLHFIKIDDRSETEISKVLDVIGGFVYVISSQNRFAIRVAKSKGVPCAFLDGLAWFWSNVPEEHFQADIIFWLNYPGISDKIPANFHEKIKIIHGITEEVEGSTERSLDEVLLYIGGCKNPLTPLPTHYLDLCASMIENAVSQKERKIHLQVATDSASKEYLSKFPEISSFVDVYEHEQFLFMLSRARIFITNGGQTATIEASTLKTPTTFTLPINLSQYALVSYLKIHEDSCLQWKDYLEIPDTILDYTEKDAIAFFDGQAETLLLNPSSLNKVCNDFQQMIFRERKGGTNILLEQIGSSGTEEMFDFLRQKWKF